MRNFAVIGDPISHSVSPQLHMAAYTQLGVQNVSYRRIQVPATGFAEFMAKEGRLLDGISVTMPHKSNAFELAEQHDAYADLKVANTLIPLKRATDGSVLSWRAYNTDIYGIKASLASAGVQEVASAGILGSGATALSLAMALLELSCKEFLLSARSVEKLAPIQELLSTRGAKFSIVPWEQPQELFQQEVVGSALAQAGAEFLVDNLGGAEPVDLQGAKAWFDVLYHPSPTPMRALHQRLQDSAEINETVLPGFATGAQMLAHQAAKQVELMLGVEQAPAEDMFQAAFGELSANSVQRL